jgi:MoxR-like ATPase
VRELAGAIRREVAKAVIGQEGTVDHLLVALLAGGHVLLEGPPGTAKTFLAQSFATAVGLDFGRIQFTPDLMPGDILGSNLFNFQTSQFTLTRGPIFTRWCWPMKSTAPRPRPRPPCSKPCRNAA